MELASLVLSLFPVLQQRLLLQFQPFWGLFSQQFIERLAPVSGPLLNTLNIKVHFNTIILACNCHHSHLTDENIEQGRLSDLLRELQLIQKSGSRGGPTLGHQQLLSFVTKYLIAHLNRFT